MDGDVDDGGVAVPLSIARNERCRQIVLHNDADVVVSWCDARRRERVRGVAVAVARNGSEGLVGLAEVPNEVHTGPADV